MSNFFNDLLSLSKKVVEASEAIQEHIDRHLSTNSTSESDSNASGTASAASGNSAELSYSSGYQRHVENGCPDPLRMLTQSDAERLLGFRVATPSTTGEEEYISAHYGCSEEQSVYLSLTVSALMPWDFVRDEVTSEASVRPLGDESLLAAETLYVRKGENFFWVYAKGIPEEVVYAVAEHVVDHMP